jgi:ArsR family transcriptional regulator
MLEAGIVGRRKQGNFAYYSIADDGVFALCEQVCGSLERQLAELNELVTGARS